MRTLRIVLLLVSPALTGGAMLAAQAVERTDVPARGVLRVTFDPRIMTWNDELTDAGLAAAFEPRCQPRREPAGGEHAGDTREGLGVLRAIRLRAGATRSAGGGMCTAPVPLRSAG